MKKIVMLLGLAVIMLLAVNAHAFEVERLVLDAYTPVSGSHVWNGMKDPHNWTLNADFKATLFEESRTHAAVGIEATPVFDFMNAVMTAKYGVFIRPFKGVEFHADHINDIDTRNVFGTKLMGGENIVGVRLVIKGN